MMAGLGMFTPYVPDSITLCAEFVKGLSEILQEIISHNVSVIYGVTNLLSVYSCAPGGRSRGVLGHSVSGARFPSD